MLLKCVTWRKHTHTSKYVSHSLNKIIIQWRTFKQWLPGGLKNVLRIKFSSSQCPYIIKMNGFLPGNFSHIKSNIKFSNYPLSSIPQCCEAVIQGQGVEQLGIEQNWSTSHVGHGMRISFAQVESTGGYGKTKSSRAKKVIVAAGLSNHHLYFKTQKVQILINLNSPL